MRSIPACTGEPWPIWALVMLLTVYPRVYGGNLQHFQKKDIKTRSIPACTGEPVSPGPRTQTRWVYPRVYGGTCAKSCFIETRRGLSPRVRGKPHLAVATGPKTTVYPRVYGGTRINLALRSRYEGLSPRVRGNLGMGIRTALYKGSIPACTGEPGRPSKIVNKIWVYPRVYGGTQERVFVPNPELGLSPRVRGNRPYP